MTAQTQVTRQRAIYSPSQPMHERSAWYMPGPLLLVVNLVLLAAAVVAFWQAAVHEGRSKAVLIVVGIVLVIVFFLVLRGITIVAPGRAHVVQLFGKYKGTVREPGMQWVNPFTNRIPVSTRIRNMETAQAKVNDADGNPIEIAAVVVWQVQDTAQATYSVDDYVKFVAIQAETAVRHIASSYPYDARGVEGVLSLRDNADEITPQLSAELTNRVQAAGVEVIETRLTRLSYAAEIAEAMLRQQQAERGRRRAGQDRRGRGRHGQDGPGAPRRGERRRTRRGAQGRHGLQPARRALQRAGHPASGEHRLALLVTAMAERKNILLRLDPAVHDALAKWAADEMRSTNAQIEFLLRRALGDAGRMPGAPGRCAAPAARPPPTRRPPTQDADGDGDGEAPDQAEARPRCQPGRGTG